MLRDINDSTARQTIDKARLPVPRQLKKHLHPNWNASDFDIYNSNIPYVRHITTT